jgi:O-antigen/teichoic acid export membrane protein
VAGASQAVPAPRIGAVPTGAGSVRLIRLARLVAHRFSWGLADQAMSSLSNAAMSLYIARELGATQFGAFAVAYVTYSFVLNASRGLATDPLLVRYSHVEHVVWKRAVQCSTATAAGVGLVAGLACLGVGALTAGAAGATGITGQSFIALGIALPGLMLQDSWRYAFFARGRGSGAFINDTIWTAMLGVAFEVLRLTHHETVFCFVLAWGLTANVAAACGPLQARLLPRLRGIREWLSKTRDLGPRYLMENTSNSGSSQLRVYAVGFIVGLTAVGYIQEGALLMGPFFVIFMGISLVTVPEAARLLRRSPQRLRLYCVLVGSALALLALLWGVILLVALPHGLGTLLLRAKEWQPAYGLVVWLTISMMGACAIAGATAGLRALGAARRSLRAMLISSAAYLLLGVLGAVLGGALGSVEGTAAATWIGALVWWWQLRIGLREYSTPEARRGRHRAPHGRKQASPAPYSLPSPQHAERR